MRSKRPSLRLLLVAALLGGTLIGFASPARAAFHMMLITEVFPGAKSAPNAQYIELQMYFPFQNMVADHQVLVYNAKGKRVGKFVFPEAVPNFLYGDFVLIATAEAEELFGITADLVMKPAVIARGGRVCWENVDCVSWGNYKGSKTDPSPTGNPFSPKEGLVLDSAIQRNVDGGMIPTSVDAEDDTDDSASDFALADPNPTNNARESGP